MKPYAKNPPAWKSVLLLFVVVLAGCNQKTSSVDDSSVSDAPPRSDAAFDSARILVPMDDLPQNPVEPNTRAFKFVYGANITEVPKGKVAKIWIPVATTNHDQEVKLSSVNLPVEYERTREDAHGNNFIYFEAEADENGEIPIEVIYQVVRFELSKANYETATGKGTFFLKANSRVPTTDEIRKSILADAQPNEATTELARSLYDGVSDHMKYDKPQDKSGWGEGDAVFACNNGFGNCTDYHSLFISSARNLKIPAKFEIGFPIPEKSVQGEIGGYHCWAKFLDKDHWVPVDISEADKNAELKDYYFGNLSHNRIMFTRGRDIELQPAAAAEKVNFLVYPYVEIDGKPHKSIEKKFRFEDL